MVSTAYCPLPTAYCLTLAGEVKRGARLAQVPRQQTNPNPSSNSSPNPSPNPNPNPKPEPLALTLTPALTAGPGAQAGD